MLNYRNFYIKIRKHLTNNYHRFPIIDIWLMFTIKTKGWSRDNFTFFSQKLGRSEISLKCLFRFLVNACRSTFVLLGKGGRPAPWRNLTKKRDTGSRVIEFRSRPFPRVLSLNWREYRWKTSSRFCGRKFNLARAWETCVKKLKEVVDWNGKEREKKRV